MKHLPLKTLSTFTTTLLLTSVLAGCIGGGDQGAGSNDEALKIFFSGDLKQIDPVVEEFEKRTADTLDFDLDITTFSNADYKEKMRMMVTAGEEMDLVFDAPWANMTTLINQGAYAELDKYFNNDEYPGLKKAFSEDFLESNKVNGKIYGVPITQTFIDLPGFYIRKDLREKYGMTEIQNNDQLQEYLKKVQQNEQGIAPIGIGQGRGFHQFLDVIDQKPLKEAGLARTIIGNTGAIQMAAIVDKQSNELLDIHTPGDPAEKFSILPSPYNKDVWKEKYKQLTKWNQYAQKDSIVEKDHKALFAAGKVAAAEGEISGLQALQDSLEASGQGEVEFYPYVEAHRNLTPGAIITDFKAWNFLCIPANSEKIDDTMKFLDWVFSSQENNDLFTFGIEGQHWEAVGEDEWKIPEDVDPSSNYSFPGYELTWNPNYIRINAEIDEKSKEYITYQNEASSYVENDSPLKGFTFNIEPVKTEVAQMNAVKDKFYVPLQHGLLKDVDAEIEKYYKEIQAAGLETVRDELKKQIEEFLANK